MGAARTGRTAGVAAVLAGLAACAGSAARAPDTATAPPPPAPPATIAAAATDPAATTTAAAATTTTTTTTTTGATTVAPTTSVTSTTSIPSTTTSTTPAPTTTPAPPAAPAPPTAPTTPPALAATTVAPTTPATVVLPAADARSGRTACTSVVHIGDSNSVGLTSPSILTDAADRMTAQYQRVGVEAAQLEISGARSIVETLDGQVNARDTAAAVKRRGYDGCWVFALGTTDTANVAAGADVGRAERIASMMAIVDDDPVLWVNVATRVAAGPWSSANMQLWNEALTEASFRYPRLYVFDWAGVVDPAWFDRDGIHYTAAGYAQRARLIADALAATFPA